MTCGGPAKKNKKKRGCPSDPDRAETIKSVRTLRPPELPPQHINVQTSLVCNVCLNILNQPILLPCNELVCGLCYTQWVAVSGKNQLPLLFPLPDGETRNPRATNCSYGHVRKPKMHKLSQLSESHKVPKPHEIQV